MWNTILIVVAVLAAYYIARVGGQASHNTAHEIQAVPPRRHPEFTGLEYKIRVDHAPQQLGSGARYSRPGRIVRLEE